MRSASTLSLLTALLSLAVALPTTASAQKKMVPGNIRAVKVEGTAWQTPGSGGSKERLSEGAFVKQGATIETAGNGNVILLFDNGSTMQIRPGTKFSISEFLVDPFDAGKVDLQQVKREPTKSTTDVFVHQGTVTGKIAKLDRSSAYNISTPLATAGIRGTVVTVQHKTNPAETTITVTEGQIQVTKRDGTSWMVSGDGQQPDQNNNTRTATDKTDQNVIVVVGGSSDDGFGAWGSPGGVNLPAGFGGGGGGASGGGGGSQAAPTPIPTPTPVKPYNQ